MCSESLYTGSQLRVLTDCGSPLSTLPTSCRCCRKRLQKEKRVSGRLQGANICNEPEIALSCFHWGGKLKGTARLASLGSSFTFDIAGLDKRDKQDQIIVAFGTRLVPHSFQLSTGQSNTIHSFKSTITSEEERAALSLDELFASTMLPSTSSQIFKQTSVGDEPSIGNSKPLRQRLSLHFRSFSSANSLSSISTRSVSTKSIKLKNSNSLWASVSAKAHHVFTRSSSSHSLKALDSGLSHSPTLALACLSTKCSNDY